MPIQSNNKPDDKLIVVAIGASAGGVQALTQLFGSISGDIEAAFLVVTHLGPHRESHLSEILGRQSKMRVQDAVDGAPLEPRVIYVLPPNAILTLEQNHLALRTVTVDQRERNPIDVCFASLARVYRDNAVGVILSGIGHDGTLGVKAIKEEGGLTIAQAHDESGPQHEGMPGSAISSGYIDVQLPVHHMGAKLQEYVRSTSSLDAIVLESDLENEREERAHALLQIYQVLRNRIGHDFEGYKEKTFLRRVQRRMAVSQQISLPAYAAFLQRDSDESGALFRDLLIGVTTFFRDTDAFAAISKHVIPRLFEKAGADEAVRVWVPGCATGEEAYSIAMLLREHMDTLTTVPKVQVFATDIDDAALSSARSGRYPAALVEGMDLQRLERFFRTEPGSYVVSKEVRDLCIFSSHSVIRDPPFSRMDFVSCRNLLIYFTAELQKTVLPVIHYALKPNGFLFLGPSENVSRHTDLFTTVDKKHRIFQRRPSATDLSRMPTWASRARTPSHGREARDVLLSKDQHMRRVIEDRVLEAYAPAHIVIDGEGDILFYSARTGKYLEPQVGFPSRQLLSMARRGLRLELRAAFREAVEKRHTIVRERLEVDVDDRVQAIRLSIEPLGDSESDPRYLVVFTDLGPSISREEAAQLRPFPQADDSAQLEAELRETRDRLQATIEEYETALEELKSGNEELVSVNEELQSTNEELETSKEELQSINEELHTVNTELGERVQELHRSSADMHNLLESTQIATVFLDRNMVIRSYTPSVTSVFNLIKTDCGRPITDVSHKLMDVDLQGHIDQVLKDHRWVEKTVRQRETDVSYLMRIVPYRTGDDRVDGALLTFVDVSALVEAEEKQRILVSELNHRVRNMLQVVMGLANQTLHKSQDLKQFGKDFVGRMQALASAYELLSRDGWRKVPVVDLVRTQLSGFASDGSRYSVEGGDYVLTANAALSLGMVLYELATNSTKYGALSTAGGHVHIRWECTAREDGTAEFILRWEESGGPAVEPPTRHGFGTELVQRQLKYELGGVATLNFNESGLIVTLAIPAKEAIEPSEVAGAAPCQ